MMPLAWSHCCTPEYSNGTKPVVTWTEFTVDCRITLVFTAVVEMMGRHHHCQLPGIAVFRALSWWQCGEKVILLGFREEQKHLFLGKKKLWKNKKVIINDPFRKIRSIVNGVFLKGS